MMTCMDHPARTAPEAAPPSPCTKVCRIDPGTGYCLGCWRTGAEIAAWPDLTATEQRSLLGRLGSRRWGP